MDTVDSREFQPTHRYIHLVEPDSLPREVNDPAYSHAVYPGKNISNVGTANVALSRINSEDELNEFPGNPGYKKDVFVINESGLEIMTEEEAVNKGLWGMSIQISNPSARRRSVAAGVYLSMDGAVDRLYSGQMHNSSEEEEEMKAHDDSGKIEKGTEFFTPGQWMDHTNGRKGNIYVGNNSKFLSTLNFRFEFRDEGGEVN